MQTPFFSVVIPTLDEAKTLPKLLGDLNVQTFTDVDVCVVDGGSKDKTVEIASVFAKEHKGFTVLGCDQKNVSVQRNLGAHCSKGSYILFLDADVRIPPYYLEGIHYNLMKKEVDAFTTFAAPDSSQIEARNIVRILNISLEGGAILGIPYALGASLGVRRDVFMQVGGFDPAITYMEDTELVRRIHKHHYSFTAYKDPLFVLNMRRYRKDGTFALTVKLIPSFLQSLLTDKMGNIDHIYPMQGGSYYKKKKSQTLIEIRELQKMLKKIVKSRSKRAQKIVDKLREVVGM